MDVCKAANLVSSLSRALEGSTNLSPYIPTTSKSDPSAGREILIIPFSKSGSADLLTKSRTLSAVIPKAGSLRAAYVRYTIRGVSSAGTTGNTPVFAAGGIGYAACQQLRWMTNSRELARISGAQTAVFVDGCPAEIRDALNRLAGVGLDDEKFLKPTSAMADPLGILAGRKARVNGASVAEVSEFSVFTPVVFSTMFPGMGKPGVSRTDSAFLEEQSLELQTRPFNKVISKLGTATGAQEVEVDLVCCFEQLNDSDRQKQIANSYKSGKPVQIISSTWELIASQTHTRKAMTTISTDAAALSLEKHRFSMRSSSSALVRNVCAIVRQVDGQTTDTAEIKVEKELSHAIDFCPISNVTFQSGGRTVFNCSPALALGQSLDAHFGTAPGGLVNAAVYRFARSADRTRYSNACSLAGMSSQSWSIDCTLPRLASATAADKDEDTNFECQIWGEKISVLTLSSSDGSLRPSLST